MRSRVAVVVCLLASASLLPVGSASAVEFQVAGEQASAGDVPVPDDEANPNLPPGLIQYSDVAERLNDIAAGSDRVSVEVFGRSAGGRDLYLATVADPDADRRSNRLLRRLMIEDPGRAQRVATRLAEDLRVPVFINASIHGNEYEGVDASLALIEWLANSDDPAVERILDNVILLVNVVQNPDGRVLDTRGNANGFDLNRDFVTNSQPETRAVRDLLVAWNPMVTLDLHGYVYPMLIEPTTPPHNPNYEYDLYIESALGQALAMEEGVLDAYESLRTDPAFADEYAAHVPQLEEVEQTVIPFRDWEVGDWDDWPPIFTPMYAMYHGSYGHTLEAPLNPRSEELSTEAKGAYARVNFEAHLAASRAALEYVAEHKVEMLLDQLEVFVRGENGVAPVPVEPGFVPGFGPEDQYVAQYPEAYVIPAGGVQESAAAAEHLVDFLLAHGIEVQRASRSFEAAGTAVPAGSYVVSMQQPRRGLANTMLEPGYDISRLTPQMYDISGWSHAQLWGATVLTVPQGTGLSVPARAVTDAHVRAQLPGYAAAYGFELDSEAAILAAGELIDARVPLRLATDGSVIVPGGHLHHLGGYAEAGVTFTALDELPDSEELEQPRIAASLGADELFVLDELGFDVTPIDEAQLNDGTASLSEFDILMVSTDFDHGALSAEIRGELDTWLAEGGGIVGLGAGGATFNAQAGLLDVGFREGPACATANGIVAVDRASPSPVTVGGDGDDTSFVYAPVWFPEVADGVRVDESYDADDVLLAGHWLGDDEDWIGDSEPGGVNCDGARRGTGQDDAAGHASVVSAALDQGGRVVLFGTEPLFRAHPRKLFGQVANALYWVSAG